MKYMTPELISRTRSTDEDAADRAWHEWEAVGRAYRKHLRSIRNDLPPGVRRLRKLDLHDARVLTMASDLVRHFSLIVELDGEGEPAGRRFELRYQLVGHVEHAVKFAKHPVLAGDGRPMSRLLYDEIESHQAALPPGEFTHCLLFTGGCELQVTFTALAIRRLRFVLPQSSASPEELVKELGCILA